jgi:regulator of chromosome condensation
MDVFAKVRAFELGDADAAAPGKVLKDRRSPRERGRMGTSVAPPPRFVDVAAGRYHTAAATDDGRAFTFGLNDRGQLGREGVVGVATPGAGCVEDSGGSAGACEDAGGADAIPGDRCRGGGACRSGVAGVVAGGALSGSGPDVHVVKVAAGRYSTAVVTESGGVVVWGLNACGGGGGDGDAAAAPTPAALLADPKSASTPRALGRNLFGQDAEDGDKAVDVAVGYLHVVIATASGKVYTCATGFDGYAGVREGFELNDDDASSRGGGVSRKSSAAAVPSSSAGGGVFAELGRPARDASEALRPARVLGALTRAKVVSVAAGRCHAAAATEDGDAFFFGCGGDRGIGGTNGSSTDADAAAGAPRRLTHPASLPTSSTKITSVAAGEYFTLAATADGAVLGWGDDASGQLGGFGGVGGRDATAPTLVEMARRRGGDGGGADVRTRRVVAGYQHAVAIAEEAERT